jgi:hypothetical protein
MEALVNATSTYRTPLKCSKVQTEQKDSNYKIQICLGCKKFYTTEAKFGEHIKQNKDCKEKHIAKAKELIAQRNSSSNATTANISSDVVGGLSPDVVQKMIADAVAEANEKNKTEMATLQKEKERLERSLKSEQAKVKVANEELKRLEAIEEMADEFDECKMYRYKFERLRYVLLVGVKPNPYGHKGVIPFMSVEDRRRMISALEGPNLLPKHAEYGEDDWYDLFKFDDTEPEPYDFPIEYEKEEQDDNDDDDE